MKRSASLLILVAILFVAFAADGLLLADEPGPAQPILGEPAGFFTGPLDDPTAGDAWNAWLGSPGYRRHGLGEIDFYAEQTNYGIGYAFVPGSKYGRYWVFISAAQVRLCLFASGMKSDAHR